MRSIAVMCSLFCAALLTPVKCAVITEVDDKGDQIPQSNILDIINNENLPPKIQKAVTEIAMWSKDNIGQPITEEKIRKGESVVLNFYNVTFEQLCVDVERLPDDNPVLNGLQQDFKKGIGNICEKHDQKSTELGKKGCLINKIDGGSSQTCRTIALNEVNQRGIEVINEISIPLMESVVGTLKTIAVKKKLVEKPTNSVVAILERVIKMKQIPRHEITADDLKKAMEDIRPQFPEIFDTPAQHNPINHQSSRSTIKQNGEGSRLVEVAA